jgi:hypothetical protein
MAISSNLFLHFGNLNPLQSLHFRFFSLFFSPVLKKGCTLVLSLAIFFIFSSFLGMETLQNHFISLFWRNFASEKKKAAL